MAVQTVLGPIDPANLGRTLTHEHLSMEFTHFYREPPKHLNEKFQKGIQLDTVGYLRQYPYSSRYNLLLNDEDSKQAVLNDVKEYKRCGGGTIVENSTEGLKRDLEFYKRVSKETGVHIVAGTGYYIADLQANNTLRSTSEDLYNHMLKELTEGCVGDSGIKAGFIGEVASVWPLKEFERTVIKTVGDLQGTVGCGVSFHPHRDKESPFEIIRLYLEAGGGKTKAVMSHLDNGGSRSAVYRSVYRLPTGTLLQNDDLLSFADLGTYCQYDLFGVEVSYYQLNQQTDMPSDAQRVDKVKLLVDEGKQDRVLLSHDIHTKHRLIDFGGHGYAHIINNVIPKMKAKGISQETIDQITIDNPKEWLAVKQ